MHTCQWNYYNYWTRKSKNKEVDEGNKAVMFKNCAPFTDCISNMNNTQIDMTKYKDGVMPMYNLIEYSDNCSKTSESFWSKSKF